MRDAAARSDRVRDAAARHELQVRHDCGVRIACGMQLQGENHMQDVARGGKLHAVPGCAGRTASNA